MLKPTANSKDCCLHNVSQHVAVARTRPDHRQFPKQTDSGSAVAGPHTNCDPSLVGFGDAYYDRLSQLIDKNLELGTDDCVCYVGDAHGAQVVPVLTERYCLLKPVTRVNPFRSPSDDSSQQMDEVFSFQPSGLKSELYFDKIIIYNSIHLFSDIIKELRRFIGALTSRGRLLIIHRPIRLNTLPFPADIVDRLRSVDLSLERLISTVQSLGLEFRWEVEESRVVTSRHKWLNMIKNGGFPPCKQYHKTQPANNPEETPSKETLSTTRSDITHELMTGVLRYAGDSDIEFVDRMVFLTVNQSCPVPAMKDPATVSASQKRNSKVNMYGSLEMKVTPEIKELLNAKKRPQQKKWTIFD